MEELTPEETGLLLARMRVDGHVQRAVPLRPEHAYPMPQVKLGAREITRARFYSALIDGEGPAEIARAMPKAFTPAQAADWINRPTFQRLVQQAMGAARVTPQRLAQKLDQMLDAEQVKFFPDGHGVIEERRVPDNDAQLKAVRLAHDILLATTEAAPPEPTETERLAEGLKELSLDELQRRAVELNGGSADARHGERSAPKRPRSRR